MIRSEGGLSPPPADGDGGGAARQNPGIGSENAARSPRRSSSPRLRARRVSCRRNNGRAARPNRAPHPWERFFFIFCNPGKRSGEAGQLRRDSYSSRNPECIRAPRGLVLSAFDCGWREGGASKKQTNKKRVPLARFTLVVASIPKHNVVQNSRKSFSVSVPATGPSQGPERAPGFANLSLDSHMLSPGRVLICYLYWGFCCCCIGRAVDFHGT